MCGISGVFHYADNRPADPAEAYRMRDVQAHRGPDGAGVYIDGSVALGHRRLSIIDLEGGAQPLSNEDRSIWVTYNGEIYNYRELAAVLRGRGHVFRSACDTEVIVHLYEELGLDLLEKLNGIFAFALWDSRRRRLLLARDRFGVKPLHYHDDGRTIRFASEIKGLLAAPEVPCEPEVGALREYLTFRHVFGSRTLFHDIRSLPAASCTTVDEQGPRIGVYWSLENSRGAEPAPIEDVKAVRELLVESVGMQMVSDVPLGTFCSGGIDSSLVTAIAASSSSAPLSTFTIGYALPEWDERPYAREVVAHYGTDSHELVIDERTFLAALREAQEYNDEPLSHPSSVPLYLLSGVAQRTVKVVLSGEGSDEAFLGYPRHLLVALRGWAERRMPGFARRLLAAGLLAGRGRKRQLVGHVLDGSLREAMLYNSAFTPARELVEVIHRDVPNSGLDERWALLERVSSGRAPLEALALYELGTYLVIALDRLDRMSMAHGLEARVPFLDHRLIELAINLPLKRKLSRGTNKAIIRAVAKEYLPPAVIERPKVGFGVPVATWLRQKGALSAEVLDSGQSLLFREGIVQREALERLIAEHRSGRANHAESLWLLLNLAVWYGRFGAPGRTGFVSDSLSGSVAAIRRHERSSCNNVSGTSASELGGRG